MSFLEKLNARVQEQQTLLCIGLDPQEQHLPPGVDIQTRLEAWGGNIIEQTAASACCFKPNIAFYEQFGLDGLRGLQRILALIPAEIPVLLDMKRGDIGSTAQAYAAAAFEQWGADAVTLNPYLGLDGIAPFLEYPGKMVFLLCNTSNPSAEVVQWHGNPPLFEHIARCALEWGRPDQIGLVVGATKLEALARVRALCPQTWILAPGVGAQGGDLRAALAAGLRPDGAGMIIPVSRGVMGAVDIKAAARELRETIQLETAHYKSALPAPRGEQTELICALYECGCVKFGNFTLASGLQSPIYIDLRRLVSFPRVMRKVASAYADVLRDLSFDHIAGVPYAALPIGAVVALDMQHSFIYPRKEVKQHGTGQAIEGAFEAGQRAVLLEDVITSGGSILTSADVLRGAGLEVSDVVVLVDREQWGGVGMAKAGLKLQAILTISQILEELNLQGLLQLELYQTVKAYLAERAHV